jgi:hypothetical protein
MSTCLEAAPPVAPSHPPAQSRAVRLKRFEREQRIVEYLNRGVSVAEIATRIGVGKKRMRAIIRDILARRMPHPPMEFVAIQVSRLNEAILVAFSAMSPTNLKAVDQVVKIVRELDRYGGAFAAEWARPAVSHLEAPTDEDVAFAKAWLGDTELADDEGDDRPEIPLQDLERIDSAPGIPAGPASQTPLASFEPEEGRGEELGGLSVLAHQTSHPDRLPLIPGSSPGRANERPEIPAQVLEKVESAPGIGLGSQTTEPISASPVSTPDLMLSLLRSAAGRGDLRAYVSGLRVEASGVALQHGDADFSFAPAGHDRPENWPQSFENMESAPGTDELDDAGSGSLPSPLVPYPIVPGGFRGPLHGVGVC